jgi:hypothetical protein
MRTLRSRTFSYLRFVVNWGFQGAVLHTSAGQISIPNTSSPPSTPPTSDGEADSKKGLNLRNASGGFAKLVHTSSDPGLSPSKPQQ